MQSGSHELFKLNSMLPARRPRLRMIEWLIAVMFIITLLIASGVFFQVSNAADSRLKPHTVVLAKSRAIAPGTIGPLHSNADMVVAKLELPALKPHSSGGMVDVSCELKP